MAHGRRSGSTATARYPRLVGETGGKDFVVAHPSADVEALVVALARGAFEYQGQKCSAASRAYVPRSLWPQVRDGLADLARAITVGDVGDFSTFFGAVIDQARYRRARPARSTRRAPRGAEVLVGGGGDDSDRLVRRAHRARHRRPRAPTRWRASSSARCSRSSSTTTRDWDETLELVDTTSPYALTGAMFADDRAAVQRGDRRALRHAAGNFYVNDKPTGAVVGQQPFGGARASGTNDKAGSALNLLRWTSPRTIKETFVPPTDWRYPHMG